MAGTLYITGDEDADRLLNTDPLALLLGMLLDQQVPMEWAFKGPSVLRERLGGHLDAKAIAAMDPEELVAAFLEKPALHRFPGSMARRAYDLCVHLTEQYGGDAAAVWETAPDGEELFRRLRALPGFGQEKSQIFLALLAKRMGQAPPGWERFAGVFADDTPRSVADCTSPATLAQVREFKRAMKAARRDKQGRPLV